MEALLRWRHAELGMVAPVRFIPIAEETGLITPIGAWALKEACRQLAAWNARLPPDQAVSMSVNVSRRQLAQPAFHEQAERIIAESGIDRHRLNLEVTETAVIDADEAIERMLRRLKDAGVGLHLDDFGTGYSSLSCLYGFPLDALKIDRAFVYQAEARREYAAVISAVMTMARNLGMRVVAEGVETKAQLAQMLAFDCDYGQGYYFSRPVAADAAWVLLTTPRNWLEPTVDHEQPASVSARS
jgi:EAL domain-containing protein (putative c-di-GMP-specific phosphodiesterase class I)